MRRTSIIFFVIFMIMTSVALAYNTRHVYLSGKVDSVNAQYVIVAGTPHYFSQKKLNVYVSQVRDKAVQTYSAKISDVRPGDFISMKIDGNVIVEVTIERERT